MFPSRIHIFYGGYSATKRKSTAAIHRKIKIYNKEVKLILREREDLLKEINYKN